MIIPLYPTQGDGSNATSIQGDAVSAAPPANGQVLVYREATQQYVPENQPAGGATELLATASFASDGFTITDSALTTMLFDTVAQSTAIYDTNTGIFTIPSSGLYMVYITYLAVPVNAITGPFGFCAVKLFVNGNDVNNLIEFVYNEVQALWVGVGSTAISLQAADELTVQTYQAPSGEDSVLNATGAYNNVNLYKL